MDLRTWLKNNKGNARAQLAENVGTSPAYLTQIAGGWRNPSPRLTLLIEEHTYGQVTRYELRPDVYGQAA